MGTWKKLSIILKDSTCVRLTPIRFGGPGLYKLQPKTDKTSVVRVSSNSGPLSVGLKSFCWQV